MIRPLRIEYPGTVYHITTRGNARNVIFGDNGDLENFFDILSDTVKRFPGTTLQQYHIRGPHHTSGVRSS